MLTGKPSLEVRASLQQIHLKSNQCGRTYGLKNWEQLSALAGNSTKKIRREIIYCVKPTIRLQLVIFNADGAEEIAALGICRTQH